MAELGGQDPSYDLSESEKNTLEAKLREEARSLASQDPRQRKKKLSRAIEISREKSKRAHQGRD